MRSAICLGCRFLSEASQAMARIRVLRAGKTQYTRKMPCPQIFKPQPQFSSRTRDAKHYLRCRQLFARIWRPQNSEFYHVSASLLSISTIRHLPSCYQATNNSASTPDYFPHHRRSRCRLSPRSTTSPASQSPAPPGSSPRPPNPPTRWSIPGSKNSRGFPLATSISSPYWPTAEASSGLPATG